MNDNMVHPIPTSNRNFYSKLSVAKNREQGRDATYEKGQDNSRASIVACLKAGEDEYSGADDSTHSEPHQVPPGERSLHGILTTGLDLQLGFGTGPG